MLQICTLDAPRMTRVYATRRGGFRFICRICLQIGQILAMALPEQVHFLDARRSVYFLRRFVRSIGAKR